MKVNISALFNAKLTTDIFSVRLHQVMHADEIVDMEAGIDMLNTISIKLPMGKVEHVKFFDDDFMVLILSAEGKVNPNKDIFMMLITADTSYILSIPYRKVISQAVSSGEDDDVKDRVAVKEQVKSMLLPSGHAMQSSIQIDLQELSRIEAYILHAFPHSERFRPNTLAVNGRKNRRVFCVLGEDKRRFRMFSVEGEQSNGETTLQEDDDVDVRMEEQD